MPSSIYDVAKRAGVSIATVSRVLNTPSAVRAPKAAAVRAAIKELNYEPSLFGRGLAKLSFRTVGVYFPYGTEPVFSSSYCIELLKGLETVLSANDFDLLIIHETADIFTRQEDIPRFVDYITQRKIDGLLVSVLNTAFVTSVLERFGVDKNFPLVYIGKKQEECFANVYAQFEEYMFSTVKKLSDYGHRNILVIGVTGHREKWTNIISRVRCELPDVSFEQILLGDMFSVSQQPEIEAAVLQSVKNGSCTAVCCEGMEQAGVVLNICSKYSIAVPGDVSVVAVEHRKGDGALLYPPLDAVYVPAVTIGSAAAELLVHRIEDGLCSEQILVSPEYIKRESVRKI